LYAHTASNLAVLRIRRVCGGLKLFTRSTEAVMRCAALLVLGRKAFLFTSGIVPRLNTGDVRDCSALPSQCCSWTSFQNPIQ
jgi:hypothetical protein